jgi:hypothetical protein
MPKVGDTLHPAWEGRAYPAGLLDEEGDSTSVRMAKVLSREDYDNNRQRKPVYELEDRVAKLEKDLADLTERVNFGRLINP